MKCYNCGNQLTDENICLSCGVDVTAYKAVVKASNAYYNLGLEKARIRDLSGAAENLRTSLSINKDNIKARNLLGLVYYEMGDIVEALTEWVVSKNYKPEKNVASSYIINIQSHQGKFENSVQTVKKYNQSLKYAKDGNYDMAVIQLKKVVAQNPNFIKAQQLLALLYIRNKEYNKAKKCLTQTLKVDRNNTLSQKYMNEISEIQEERSGDVTEKFLPRRKVKHEEREPLSGDEVIMPHTPYKEPSNGAITVINILVGVLIGAALVWFLIIPSRDRGLNEQNNQTILEYSDKLSSANLEIDSLNKQLQDLKSERDSLNQRVNDIAGTDGNNKLLIALINAANSYIANDKKAAANYLIEIDDVSTLPSDSAKNLYTTIAAATFVPTASELYTQGRASYTKGDYAEAADALSKAYKMDNSKVDIVYYCAKSYESLQQTDNAKKYYQYIVTSFPASKYVSEANSYISSH